ncbi:uncharacterized protein LOC128269853 [Anopheles cruzii]|uniref:uncharacterized protein LOC128269853 n=1 Tax=Anopheles cruzii TaxID=68878 RepID=UPI0022EC803D|nr:uncharacterized protein LOC128269853 [Anopheles cruzii]
MAHKELRLEVAKLRALVKTARTNIVRKLLRDRKFWSNKLTTSSDNSRAAKKAEASEAISQHIRSVRTYQLVKDVIRFEVRKNDPSTKVSTDIADRTLLRFHADTKLSSAVKSLVDRFELRRNDPLIDKVVQESRVKTSESTDDTARKKKKKPKPNTAKAKKVQSKVDKPKSQKQSKAAEKTKSIAKNETDEDEDDQSDHSIATEESDTADERPIEKSKDKSKPELPAKQSKKKRNKKGTPANLKPPEEDDEDEDGSTMVQDSFFVTESGGNYVAVAPVLKKGEQESSDEVEEAEQSWKLSFKRKKYHESGPPNASNGSQTGQRGKGKGNKPMFATADDARPAKRNRNDQGKIEAEPDLHPSWLAKQKQKGIQPFAGKKVVFDEDTSSKGKFNEDLHPSWAAKQAQKGIKPFAGRKTVFDDESAKPKGAPVGDLHPSWAAKQAQKGIKPFAGKKINFDEDSSAAPIVKSANDLHPSWAAKQAQKGIKPFAGKKIIFGDQGANGGRPQAASKEVETNLHPSWVAKQAQKGLKPFAGKKTTFDDDETTSTERRKTARTKDSPTNGEMRSAKLQSVTNDLHPSWAAKQAQKGIKQFEGKKISFGD